MHCVVCWVTLMFLFAPIQAFSVRKQTLRPISRVTSCRLSSSREEEIARLEEQLRKLKEGDVSEGTVKKIKSKTDEELQKYAVDERVLEKIRGKDMLLSESDLIEAQILDKNEETSVGGKLVPVFATVAMAVFLFFFAQVPVGQEDLSRYSVTGNAASKTIDLGDMNPNRPQN
ncbi:hypothetical protein FisN_13Lu202 [Fistulifera solaris]|uniref:SAP domain-containing protein n=1 Tax=Fistulifera solaris TaxID=1519565 RepID=A0A1Z5KME5_FISSO|nr:hypothetical protein FisN_13Lu202 [Fistulifera solaris]|eukprot:GAX27242.1 hypothetical protein FisN_13Lu202 [Fistulifera solaris]